MATDKKTATEEYLAKGGRSADEVVRFRDLIELDRERNAAAAAATDKPKKKSK